MPACRQHTSLPSTLTPRHARPPTGDAASSGTPAGHPPALRSATLPLPAARGSIPAPPRKSSSCLSPRPADCRRRPVSTCAASRSACPTPSPSAPNTSSTSSAASSVSLALSTAWCRQGQAQVGSRVRHGRAFAPGPHSLLPATEVGSLPGETPGLSHPHAAAPVPQGPHLTAEGWAARQ